MRVLITGGAGFIGSRLVRACLEQGDDVRVLDDFSTGRAENLLGLQAAHDLVKGSLVDFETVQRSVSACEVVYHLGALPSAVQSVDEPARTHAVNASGTVHVLEAARQAGVRRVVFASSCAIYGSSTALPLKEELAPLPESPYALQKLSGELYCQQFGRLYGLQTVALRYFNVFGPRQDPRSHYAAVVPRFLTAVVRGVAPHIHGDGQQSRDFVHVDDVVAATRAAALEASECAGQTLNVARGERVTVLELLGYAARAAGREALAPVFEPARAGDVRHSQADISKAERLLGWRPRVTLAKGLASALSDFDPEAGA